MTTDAIDTRLDELESIVSKARAVQVGLLRELDLGQIPMADGYRHLAEWMVSRSDVSPETAGGLTRLATSDREVIDTSLADGMVTMDRAVELTRLAADDPVSETDHLPFPRLRHHIAVRRRHKSGRRASQPAQRAGQRRVPRSRCASPRDAWWDA